jgi:hypothetical protein
MRKMKQSPVSVLGKTITVAVFLTYLLVLLAYVVIEASWINLGRPV